MKESRAERFKNVLQSLLKMLCHVSSITGVFVFNKIYEQVEFEAKLVLKEKTLNLYFKFKSDKALRLVNDKNILPSSVHGRLVLRHIFPFM